MNETNIKRIDIMFLICLLFLSCIFFTGCTTDCDDEQRNIDAITINSGQSDPTRITVSSQNRDERATATVNLTITVWATDHRLEGCTITLTGCGSDSSVPANTGSGGTVTFPGLIVTLGPGSATGMIKVTCEKEEYADYKGEILVVRG